MSAQEEIAANLTEEIRQHADIVVGHYAVHPDRSACGGVDRCGLMRAELNASEEILASLVVIAQNNVVATVAIR